MPSYSFLYTSSNKTKRQRYEEYAAALIGTRKAGGFDTHWQDIADHFMPRRVRFTVSDRNRGDRRNQKIIDSTGKFAAATLRSGLHAGMSSPARPWFSLSTPDPELAEFGPVKLWLHTVTQRMRAIFATTNLYNALPTLYGDYGLFGTAAMSHLEHDRSLFRCKNYPIGSYALGLDEDDLACAFTLEYQLTVRQVVQQFGVRPGTRDIDWAPISATTKQHWTDGNYETPIDLTWLVQPNEEADQGRLEAKYKPYTSCYWETASRERGDDRDKFLRESGFDEFPFFCPRWEVTGSDTYGTDCPGMTALGDVRALQVMEKEKAKLVAKAVSPPMKGPSVLRTQKTSVLPGDITYVDGKDNAAAFAPIHEPRLEGYQHLSTDAEYKRFLIRRAFYEDLFLMLAASDPQRGSQPITAREVQERHEEKLLALGPVLERTNDELFRPLIDRTYNVMDAAGLIPDVPPELDGVKLKVEFTSILAQAQKLISVASLDRFVLSVAQLVEPFPGIRHKVNEQQIADVYGTDLGVDPRIIRSDDEAEALANAEAQQAQEAAAAEQAQMMATAAAQAGAKPIAPDSPLDRLTQMMGAA